MRFLISALLLFLSFFAPLQGEAAIGEFNNIPDTNSFYCSGSESQNTIRLRLKADLPYLNQQRSSQVQCRYATIISFIDNPALLPGNIDRNEIKIPIQPYFYSKPIGLKLIFPKHYFY